MLGRDIRKTPVDVRLALVQVYLPFGQHGSGSSVGKSVSIMRPPRDRPNLPTKEASDAVERLLVSELNDTERRFGMERDFSDFSVVDPRVCDMAAHALSSLWPDKYRFQWEFTSTKCNAEIAGMRNRWRSDHGLPALPPPADVAIPEAKKRMWIPCWIDLRRRATMRDARPWRRRSGRPRAGGDPRGAGAAGGIEKCGFPRAGDQPCQPGARGADRGGRGRPARKSPGSRR